MLAWKEGGQEAEHLAGGQLAEGGREGECVWMEGYTSAVMRLT